MALRQVSVMNGTIDLDCQLFAWTVEVQHVLSRPVLTAEFASVESAPFLQIPPELCLGGREAAPQLATAWLEPLEVVETHVLTTPIYPGRWTDDPPGLGRGGRYGRGGALDYPLLPLLPSWTKRRIKGVLHSDPS